MHLSRQNRGGVLYITSICFTLDEDVDFNKPANCSAVIELFASVDQIEVEGVPIIDTLSPSFLYTGQFAYHIKSVIDRFIFYQVRNVVLQLAFRHFHQRPFRFYKHLRKIYGYTVVHEDVFLFPLRSAPSRYLPCRKTVNK